MDEQNASQRRGTRKPPSANGRRSSAMTASAPPFSAALTSAIGAKVPARATSMASVISTPEKSRAAVSTAVQFYEEICPTEVRRFIANDPSMPSIRAYVMIAGMIEGSESEVAFAKSKVEKAKKKALASEIVAEEKLLEKAIDHVYKAHPKWVKEKTAE